MLFPIKGYANGPGVRRIMYTVRVVLGIVSVPNLTQPVQIWTVSMKKIS